MLSADRARHLPALRAMDAQETPCRRAQTTHCRHTINRLKHPDIADRMIPGNWEGDLIIGQNEASACATLVERTTRYLIIVALPLGRRADQVCNALTRRIQDLPEGAIRTLTKEPQSPATTPISTPSPTSRATVPEQPSATAPPQKHSTSSLLPPIDTAPSQIATTSPTANLTLF